MGCASSKPQGASQEIIVSAAIKQQPPSSRPCVAATAVATDAADAASVKSDAKSSLGSLAKVSVEPIMLLDTRGFDVENKREDAVRSLGVVDTPIDDPRFNAITKLMASIFQTPVALITLITEDRVWFKSKVGPFGACVSREGSWCNYISIPNTPEVLITEDASEDARFSANPYVAGAPFIKFYAGAPLVGKSGMRYGTLCVVDLKRRSFTAEMYALLVNFASLVVQELERDTATMSEVQADVAAVAASQQHIAKMVGAAQSGMALVDVRSRSWPLLYANEAFAQAEGGACADDCLSHGFWDLFEPVEGDSQGGVMQIIDAAVAAGRPARAPVTSKRTGLRVNVVLRPGSSDQLATSKAPVGIPNWVPSERAKQAGCHAGVLPGGLSQGGEAFEGPAGTGSTPQPQLANCFWFVSAEASAVGSARSVVGVGALGSAGSTASTATEMPDTPGGSAEAMLARDARKRAAATAAVAAADKAVPLQTFFSQPLPELFKGLEMGPLIGSGSFGRVYRGMWRDAVVAVKLIDCTFTSHGNSSNAAEAAVAEAELSKRLDHPCVVKTYEYAMLEPQNGGRGGGTLWMVQHMCNHGTLIEAVDRGWMRRKRSLAASPDMGAVLRTLREVAEGMAFLHSQHILHCDLTGNNVLLDARQPSAEDPRQYCARVGDFGLARVAHGEVSTATFGTCSHMAPELMTDGVLTPAADVWSFGVLCWEMYSGVRAYVGLRMPNIVYLVTSGKGALKLPAGTPKAYNALMQACLDPDHKKRPSFEELISTIDQLLAGGPEEPTVAPPAPEVTGGPCKAAADELTAAAKAMESQQTIAAA